MHVATSLEMSEKISSSTLPPLTAAATPGNAVYRLAQVISPLRSRPNHVHDAITVRAGLPCGSRFAVSVRCLSENLTRKVLRLCEFSTGVAQQLYYQAKYAVTMQAPAGTHSQMVAVAALLSARHDHLCPTMVPYQQYQARARDDV